MEFLTSSPLAKLIQEKETWTMTYKKLITGAYSPSVRRNHQHPKKHEHHQYHTTPIKL